MHALHNAVLSAALISYVLCCPFFGFSNIRDQKRCTFKLCNKDQIRNNVHPLDVLNHRADTRCGMRGLAHSWYDFNCRHFNIYFYKPGKYNIPRFCQRAFLFHKCVGTIFGNISVPLAYRRIALCYYYICRSSDSARKSGNDAGAILLNSF